MQKKNKDELILLKNISSINNKNKFFTNAIMKPKKQIRKI